MKRDPTAVQRLIDVLGGTSKNRSRTRMTKMTCNLNKRHVFPTGVLENSVGLAREGKWWVVRIYYFVGDSLVATQQTTNMSRGRALQNFQIMSSLEIFNRPSGPAIQRLYKKDDEYTTLEGLSQDVLTEQYKTDKGTRKADVRVQDQDESTVGSAEQEHSEPSGESESD